MIAKSSLLWVSYLVSVRIIFWEKKATRCHRLKLSKVSWLRTLLIIQPDVSVSIRIWRSRLKWWRIEALRNTCLNLVNASLAPGVRKSKVDLDKFLDLDKLLDLDLFWTSFPTSSSSNSVPSISPPWSSLPSSLLFLCLALLPSTPTPPLTGRLLDSVLPEVFNIEVSGATIRLNPWINHQ